MLWRLDRKLKQVGSQHSNFESIQKANILKFRFGMVGTIAKIWKFFEWFMTKCHPFCQKWTTIQKRECHSKSEHNSTICKPNMPHGIDISFVSLSLWSVWKIRKKKITSNFYHCIKQAPTPSLPPLVLLWNLWTAPKWPLEEIIFSV